MSCADAIPVDGPGWAELAECLDGRELPEAAHRAWRHAWGADPAVADDALAAATRFAHDVGDDRLLVDIAGSMPALADRELAGHLALARGDVDAVSDDSCRYPFARVTVAHADRHGSKFKSRMLTFREIRLARDLPPNALLGDLAAWETRVLVDVALLGVASLYALFDRGDEALKYTPMVGEDGGPFAAYTAAWSSLLHDDRESAAEHLERAIDVVPEASVISVRLAADAPERAERAAEAHDRWDPVRAELATLAGDPAATPEALRDSDMPRAVWEAQGRMEPAATWARRSHALGREERRARGPAEGALVAEARADVDRAYGAEIAGAAARAVARIDEALEMVDLAVADPAAPALTLVHVWMPADFGWPAARP